MGTRRKKSPMLWFVAVCVACLCAWHATAAELPARYGDVDGDGTVSPADALLVLQHSVELVTLEAGQLWAADLDQLVGANAADALLILQHSVGLISSFPIETLQGSLRLDEAASYTAQVQHQFDFLPADPLYEIVQGGYFDGEQFYVAMVYGQDGKEFTRIQVMDAQGNLLRLSEPLALDHANNITYNPNLGQLVVTHCQSEDGHYYRYSLVDPQTLEITQTGDLEFPFFAMAYSPALDRYASSRWSGESIDISDGEMNLLATYAVETPQTLSQGMWCDESYLYFIRSALNGYPSELRVYDWEARLVHVIPLELSASIEPENVSVVNGVAYIACNRADAPGGVVYSLNLVAQQP